MGDCNICCEKYNKTTRKPVECSYCHQAACRSCTKTYMFGSIQEPHCMGCKVPWSQDFLASNFPKNFLDTDLRAHREKVLLEREKALLPETQLEIQRRSAEAEAHAIARLALFYDQDSRPVEAKFYYDKAVALCEGVGIPAPMIIPNSRRTRSNEPPKPVPARSCIDEGCRGFILKGTWQCGLCHKKVCKRCMVELIPDTDHVCKDEDVETTKLLLNNTKPCPGCGIMISKVDGCSQMWCVNCHVTFDWNTLERVTDRVHNPHYYEWMRRNGRDIPREPGDLPPMPVCGQLPTHDQLVRALHGLVDKPTRHAIQCVLTIGYHIEDVQLREPRRRPVWDVLQGRYVDEGIHGTLRKMYLKNEITEDEWKRKLFLEEKKKSREEAIRGVFELYLMQVRETFTAILARPPAAEVLRMHAALTALADYCNDAFHGISRTYGTIRYSISIGDGTIRKVRN